jgi:glyoxylase-like metal-dependent hydrolase (beta-lactamase superfamily II)
LLGRTFYSTAAYWVDGLLIDTGCAHTADELLSATRGWQIDQVVNTHSHEDHIGANAAVQERFRCPIRAHPDALPILEDPRRQPLQFYRRLLWGWPRPSLGEPLGAWIETARFRFEVIHTPGHGTDHICLFEPDRGWLFSGDAYIGGKDRTLRQGYDIYGMIASLKRLARLPVKTIFSGSGSVRRDGVQPLQDKVTYLQELGERVRILRDQGLSPGRIRRQLFGREQSLTYITFGHFSGLRLVQSYLDGFQPTRRAPAPEDEEAVDGIADPSL